VIEFYIVVVEEAKTHFVLNEIFFFRKIVALRHNYKKHDRAREAKEIIVV